ncbi:hypothetical protein SAMN06265222_10655 [Neorhodopirellula lusitana]|uniref:Uncharacterized protein n=1 Tax=Neorhodopirellula lusitana TaxID=445327 RepID=A0ABY1Q3T5_9BACT|nr:hypothetical protein [Neorhodopirellula lusitana]SMP58499.1 hypothetical protein SAMN06265222_10655 [Neorhodopirellula lusitana]
MKYSVIIAFVATSVTLVGCTTFQKDSGSTASSKSFLERMPWSKSDKNAAPEPYPNPVKLAAVWSPETLTQAGRVPTRGFGGRVFFYDEKSRPVPVEGTLVVHGFKEDHESEKPDVKRYEFTPEQFTKHFSSTDLGASYSVWIPWDAVGGRQERVALVASFKTATGKTLQGSSTTVLLPGAKTDREAALAQRFSPQYRQWQAAASGKSSPTSGLTTTTIKRSATPSRSMFMEPGQIPSSSTWNLADQTPSSSGVNVAMRRTDEGQPEAGSNPSSYLPVMPAGVRLPGPDAK